MKSIWNYINSKNWKDMTKVKALVAVSGLLFGLVGLLVWGIIQLWTLQSIEWMTTFILFFLILSWFEVLRLLKA